MANAKSAIVKPILHLPFLFFKYLVYNPKVRVVRKRPAVPAPNERVM